MSKLVQLAVSKEGEKNFMSLLKQREKVFYCSLLKLLYTQLETTAGAERVSIYARLVHEVLRYRKKTFNKISLKTLNLLICGL